MSNGIRRSLALLCVACTLMSALSGCKKQEPEAETQSEPKNSLIIAYASEGVTAVDDSNALQAAVDEAYADAAKAGIGLDYKNQAFSEDGVNFTCYLGNAAGNTLDMFIALYGDEDFTDELYVSGLIRPGTAFDSITLNHPLETGTHTVYCAFTQVAVEDGQQVIDGQVIVTLDFTVA